MTARERLDAAAARYRAAEVAGRDAGAERDAAWAERHAVLQEIVANHKRWLCGEAGSTRANLANANLANADLAGAYLALADLADANLANANLANANLEDAYLARANLANANLADANLANANLEDAYLARANLANADLAGANLANANLANADLAGANLANADLADANLANANLANADLAGAYLARANLAEAAVPLLDGPPTGDLVVYKKTRQGVVTLTIPAGAKRSAATTRKCRAEYAIVSALPRGVDVAYSLHDWSFAYRIGATVRPRKWCDDRWQECAEGIHFFLTREEAEAYQ